MKHVLGLGAAVLLAALTFSAPASAQMSTVTGVGAARTANQPSAVGLATTEGRSGYRRGWPGRGLHRGWYKSRHYGPRHRRYRY